MPPRPKKPCRHAGCRLLTDARNGLCDTHQGDATAGKFADSKRASATERGYGSAWRKLRDQIMVRDCGLCQLCLRAGKIKAAVAVDHINPKSAGGTDEESNLQAICKACHDTKTQREAATGMG